MIDVLNELMADNPDFPAMRLKIFADAMDVYYEASANIKKNGSVCVHPRTGTPIENPYLKIRAEQSKILAKLPWDLKCERVQELLKEYWGENA